MLAEMLRSERKVLKSVGADTVHTGSGLNTESLAGSAVWGGLKDVALLEEACP